MKYIYCTIAIGEKYFIKACNFVKQLNKISSNHYVLIVTDCQYEEINNVTFIRFDENETKIIKNCFNYNLKYIPIMESTKLNYDFVIFFDADWEIYQYSEKLLLSFLDDIQKTDLDFIYERPHSIGHSKNKLHECFWRHKIEPYGLLNTNQYDNGQVVNEQFMVFKNNKKLKTFVEKWKERSDFGVKNDIWAFAEGLEIGMSAVDANMNMDWKKMFDLRNFFKFVANDGNTHIRF
jgi:hypothetical protein